MALATSPVPSSIQDAKLLPFHSSGKNESDLWDSYEENASSHGHQGEGGLNLASMVTTLDPQKQQQQDKHNPAPTSGLSRNASFDSVTSHDSCTASFSTGSPVTVLPPLSYTTCSGTGMGISSSTMSTHAAACGWTSNLNSNNKRSSGLEAPEEQQQPPSQESIFNTFSFHEQMLLPEDCEQLLASPMGGTLPSMLEFPPFSRFDEQVCASNCSDFSPVNELECLLPTSHRTSDSSKQQAAKSPESVGNNNVHSPSPVQQPQAPQQQQEDFCQEFLVGDREMYAEHNARRSDCSILPPPPAARRRLSWSEYQLHEPQRLSSAQPEGLQFHSGFSNSQTYDSHHHLPSVVPLIGGVSVNPFRSTSEDTLVGAAAAASGGGSSLKRPYSAMLMQQPVASTCSISSSAPASSHNSSYLKFAPSAPLPVPVVPKSVSNTAPILPPTVTNVSHSSCSNNDNQQDVAAFSALLYKNQSTSEMMQQLQQQQQAQGQGTSSSDSGARPVPPPKLRRRHGTATDPQSIAARTRRERFSDRIRILQSLVPNGERLDTVSMLGHTLEYVRFLQHQVWQLYNGNDDAAASPDSESREKWKEFMDAQTVVA